MVGKQRFLPDVHCECALIRLLSVCQFVSIMHIRWTTCHYLSLGESDIKKTNHMVRTAKMLPRQSEPFKTKCMSCRFTGGLYGLIETPISVISPSNNVASCYFDHRMDQMPDKL